MPDQYPDVLVVDDDPDMRDILDTALSSLGYKTHVADDGDVALDLFHQHRPGLVISDIYMPRLDGVRLMEEIKKESPEIPVILITGYSHLGPQESTTAKPDALLRKPFNLKELLATIREVLGMENDDD